MLKTRLVEAYNFIINRLSFYRGLYKIRGRLNDAIDRPEAIEHFPESHPRGFIKKFRKRRISIVESYVKITGFLESAKGSERLAALKLLTDHILHSKSLKMPLNTARVQMALMKAAVKNRDDKRVQMERLRDFSICSFGQPKLIRKYLDELNIIEAPETGQQLKDLNMGWDSHVHDNSSYGRKTPTQLIIDAFIKGISQLTVVYNTLSHPEIITEAVEAGQVLGITVNMGLEFSVGQKDNKFHYIYLFPHFENTDQLFQFLEKNKKEFSFFLEGIETNQETRIQIIADLIHHFNLTYLPQLNEGYKEGSIYHLEELKLSDIDAIIPLDHVTRMHLGEVLYRKFQPVLLNRVLYLKAQKKWSDTRCKNGQMAEWEHLNIEKKYEQTREAYRQLNPEKLRGRYFSSTTTFEPETVFDNLGDIFKSGGENPEPPGPPFKYRANIKIIHPLEHGLAAAVRTIIENCEYIGLVEIYNMHDSINRDHRESALFSRFINLLHSGEVTRLLGFLKEHHIAVEGGEPRVSKCMDFCRRHPLAPSCGSDSTGRTSYIPGMGFIFRRDLTDNQSPDYLKKHYTLPDFVSRTIARLAPTGRPGEADDIISMGKSKEFRPTAIGDEKEVRAIPPSRTWRYLNPVIKNIFYILLGFIPAFLTVGLEYTLVWFGITFIRNAVTDIISGRGYRPREWHIENIDFDNLSHSLFWTGFSVPLLDFVKNRFDLLYPFQEQGFLFEFSKFFFICIINGLYLSSHNKLRGFDRVTVRANFFRSILAWPFAAAFAPLGNLLLVPSIVQAKFWSDFVAGVIEGSGKFNQLIKLRKRDLEDLFPGLRSKNPETKNIAILDLLYLFRKDPRTKNSLRYILFQAPTPPQKLLRLLRLKKKKAPRDFSDYNELLKWFSDTSHFFKLTDFILERCPKEQVLYLTDLASETFDDFHRWLLKNKPGR
jgi:hypothetical protein